MSIDLKNYTAVNVASSASNSTPKKKSSIFDLLNKDIQFFGTQLSLKKKEAFYAELGVLLNAGLDLKTTLDLIEENQKNEKEHQLIADIKNKVIQGLSLSSSMQQTQKFSSYEIFSIKIAEESGKLPSVIEELTVHFTKNIQYRRLLISALTYPILVIFVALLVLVFLLNFLVPMFSDLYARLGHDLPTLTVYIIKLSNIVQQYSVHFLLLFSAASIFLYMQRKKIWLRKISASLLLKTPIVGSLIKQLYLARFSQALSFLLNAKIPLLNALSLVQKMINFYPIENSINHIKKDILKGTTLHKSMLPFSIYPNRMTALIRVGEEANQLDNMLNKLANQYNNEVEDRTKLLGSLIEPILIVFLAIIVGLILVSMYLPIFQLVSNFG